MHGAHLVHHWARTQTVVSLSSAEAELNALLKAGSELLGAIEFCKDLGLQLTPLLKSDSSAAQGILSRRGSGKVKHLETKQLWLQDKVRTGKLSIQKVSRQMNPADVLTHHCSRDILNFHSISLGLELVNFY